MTHLAEHKELLMIVAIGAILAIVLIVKEVQRIGLEKIRSHVYKLFVVAEHEFQYGDNTEKFEYVVNLARSAIPVPFNLFITESLLRKVVQAWFDLTKDLLDDGKMNGTGKTVNE